MASLKGSKTEGNLKAAFAGESQANRRYLYFAQKADVEASTTSPPSSAPPPKARRAMPMAILNIWNRWAIPPRACRSARRAAI